MASPWMAAIVALFLWWFSTGAILWVVKSVDGRGRDAHVRAVIAGLPVLLAGVVALDASLSDTSVAGVYIGFLAALAIWGWIELAFLCGVVTGPNARMCPAGVAPFERFMRAWGTIAYHEILLTLTLTGILAMSWGVTNPIAFWTFAVLFFARISAKLNLFFGVPKINVEFLPAALAHLPSHFRHARLNPVFPISVTALSFAIACWLERIHAAESQAATVGFALLAALTVLALLEHWLMVVRLPDEKLWRWAMPAPKTNDKGLLREDGHGL